MKKCGILKLLVIKTLTVLFTFPFLLCPVFAEALENPELPAEVLPETATDTPAETPQTETPQAAPKPEKTLEEQRLELIRYGTENEIAGLIKTLRGELQSTGRQAEPGGEPGVQEDTLLDDELKRIAGITRNRSILSGIFGYFGDRKKEGLEERALRVLEERDNEANESVLAAMDYLGKCSVALASDLLREIIDGAETAFLGPAIRALGHTALKGGADETAEYLVEYYENNEIGDESRREIIAALGETRSARGIPLLSDIVDNSDERTPLRMAALDSLAKIGDDEGLPAILKAVGASDPNVRSAAVGALGPFSGEKADAAVIEAFRDSYYRTRLAAARSARERKLTGAIPFLRYRSEHDEVPQVRDEAIKALGAIGNAESEAILEELFRERKNSAAVRITAGEMLIAVNSEKHAEKLLIELDAAKAANQNVLYNGFLRILGRAKSGKLEALARRFFESGGIEEKSYAVDICSNNEFTALADELRKLAEGKNLGLSRRAKKVLEKWGLQ
ncbi:MAG: HEAT repeat domain-containing protein [Treponema sp.]|jgi:HEAT repeat protein|nr:HEAT repeat domain-containing protein [Treponema sp.]